MSNKPEPIAIKIDLTESQKQQIKSATGKDVDSIELGAQELEERIAPVIRF